MQSLNQLNFSERASSLLQLCIERLKLVLQNKNKAELENSFEVIGKYISDNFTAIEKRNCLIAIGLSILLAYFLFEGLTFRQIDQALINHQSARAESLIRQRLVIMPANRSLKLRLAHAYLGLEREKEAKAIIEEVQKTEPKNSYIPKVALALSQSLKRQNKSYEAIPILERISASDCKTCKSELRDLYTLEGRNSLLSRNLERANFFLSKALSLAEKLQESESSINHRRRELARAYNLQASQLIKAKEADRAIEVLEKSVKVFPMGQTHLMLAKLYFDRQSDSEDLKKAVESYEKAYSFGLTDPENISSFNRALSKLKQVLKQEGVAKEEIERVTESYSLIENPNEEGSKNTKLVAEEQKQPQALPATMEEKSAQNTQAPPVKANVYSDAADAGAGNLPPDETLEVE